jgi:hypothetical protein
MERSLPLILLLLTLVFWAGFMTLALRSAALPDEAAGTVAVVFPFGQRSEQSFNALLLAEGRLVSNTWLDTVWLVHSAKPGFVGRLKALGAWTAFKPSLLQSLTVGGCFLVINARES